MMMMMMTATVLWDAEFYRKWRQHIAIKWFHPKFFEYLSSGTEFCVCHGRYARYNYRLLA